MFQPDLFTKDMIAQVPDLPGDIRAMHVAEKRNCGAPPGQQGDSADMDLPALLERLATMSARPRYTFMVLNLIARAAGASDRAGPYVRENGQVIPVRDWLSDAMLPMAQRDARRLAVWSKFVSTWRPGICSLPTVKMPTVSSPKRSASGCYILDARTLAVRSPIWFARGCSIVIIRGIMLIIATVVAAARQSTPSHPPFSEPWEILADERTGQRLSDVAILQYVHFVERADHS